MPNRRKFIAAFGTLAVGTLAGCSGDDEETGIEIEYSVSDPRNHDEIPELIVEHPNPEGFRWIVVEFELVTGSFDADDIMGLTQVDVQGNSHFTRAVEITSPDEEFLTSSDDSYVMEQGTQGKAYYRVPEDAESGAWIVEQLENQHGEVEAQKTETDDATSSEGPDLIFEEGQSHSFSGDGMAETEMFELDEGLMSIGYQSESDDILTADLVAIDIDGNGRHIDDRLIINRRAPIEGELMNIVSGGTYLIDVDVDGPWEFEIEQPSASHDEVENPPFERSDDQPVYYGPVELPEGALIHGQHSGEGGFSVDTITVDGHWDGPINDSGEVDSTRPLRDDGIAWISVYRRDNRSIEILEQED